MSKAWSGGSSRRWRFTRAVVLRENERTNNGMCVLALPGVCTGLATCVHHTLGRAATGDDIKYLVASCRACNTAVGDPARGTISHKKISGFDI